jgi:two-component system NtrC family sensor kinase
VRWRITSIAFLLTVLSVGTAWLSVQPVLAQLFEAAREGHVPAAAWMHRARSTLPWLLALDLAVATGVIYLVLYAMVERPLRRTEQAIEQLGQLGMSGPFPTSGGPLLSRLESALSRSARALLTEQAVTRQQMVELRESSARLGVAQAELAASERLATVGRLAAGVAHEVGNPLSGILGYLSVASARAKDPELQDYLNRIEQEVQRIDEIVRSLLDLGRPAAGEPTIVELAKVAEASLRLAKAAPEFARVQTMLAIDPGTTVRTQPGPLAQVLLNLFINAAQAMGGVGEIQIRALPQGDRVRVDIQDTGPGIPPDLLGRVFEPFFTTKTAQRGTGLGLAISRHLMTTMNGQLEASNAEGGGARFTLFLPAA